MSSGEVLKPVGIKEKIIIPEREFTEKLIDCSTSSVWGGVHGFLGGTFLIPFILKRMKFIPTVIEARVGIGVVSGVVLGLYLIDKRKTECDRILKETYEYKPITDPFA